MTDDELRAILCDIVEALRITRANMELNYQSFRHGDDLAKSREILGRLSLRFPPALRERGED